MTDVEAARAAMASMLVAALEEAERERDLSVKREPTSAELAAAAWSKLQYDFPVVSPAELDALAKEMEAEAGRSTAPPPAGAALAYAPTNPLVAAVIEGASRTPADAAADDACAPGLRRAFQRLCAVVLVRVPARLAKADTLDELARADAFLSKYRAAARDDDELRASGVSRDAFPDDFPSSSSASDEGETEEARAKSADDDAPPPSAAADPEADSDASDWEPLEPEARGADAPVPRFGRDVGVGGGDASEGYANDESARIDGPETRRTRVSRKLVDLLERARYAYFDAEERARSSLSSASSAWALSGVGNAAADLVERACSDDSNANAPFDDGSATRACGDRALALLIERWRVAGVGAADGADVNALRRCLRALGVFDGNDASKARRRRARAGARTLGTLCAPFVLFAGAGEAADEGSRADEERRARALWPIAAEALAPVARTLDEALADRKDAAAVRAARGGACATETERLETLAAACCATIAFYASRAPGNASVGTDLLKSGALRAAAATFAALEGECERRDAERGEERSEASEREASSASALASEAARRCLLLASAASPESAAFALAVPGVRRAIEMRRAFASPGGTRAAHGALWALVSPARLDAGNETRRASDSDGSFVAETGEKACAERLAASARDDPVVAVDALGLLRLVQLASRARGKDAPPLFSHRADAPLRVALRDAAAAHAAAVAAAAAARGGAAAPATRKPSSSDDDSDAESDARDARSTGVPAARLCVDDETEKRAAAASAALRLIKEIVDGFGGGAGARKCD